MGQGTTCSSRRDATISSTWTLWRAWNLSVADHSSTLRPTRTEPTRQLGQRQTLSLDLVFPEMRPYASRLSKEEREIDSLRARSKHTWLAFALVLVPLGAAASAQVVTATKGKVTGQWNLCKNKDDVSRPSQYDATKRADVSTRLGQSLLHWSRHIESFAQRVASALVHGHNSPTPPRLLRLRCLTYSAQIPTFTVSN